MATTQEHKQLLFDTFVTAMEGGIGYWSVANEYHWGADLDHEAVDDFYAVIVETEDDEPKTHRINKAVIARGFKLAINPPAALRDFETPGTGWRKIFAGALATKDGGEIDSTAADIIVQMGLFGRLIYG